MFRNILHSIFHFIAALSAIFGIALLAYAFGTPGQYTLSDASAAQVTQVYVQALTFGVEACALFLLTILIEVSAYVSTPRSDETLQLIVDNARTTNQMLSRIYETMQHSDASDTA